MTDDPDPTGNPNLTAVRESYAAGERGDVAGILAPLTADTVWTEMAGHPYGGSYRGPDQVRANVLDRIGAEWDGFRVDPDSYLDGGDTIVVTGAYSGTYRATGQPMTARFAHVWRMRDGKAVSFTQYTDTLLVDRAIHPDS